MRLRRISMLYGLLVVASTLLLGLWGIGCEDMTTGGAGNQEGEGATSGQALAGTTSMSEGSTSTLVGASTTDALVTPTTAATPTTQALSSAETLLPNGHIRAAGIIDDAWQDAVGRHLRIDYVDVFTWDEAVAAGMEDPAYPHDGFWYSNVNPMLREFDVSSSAEIYTSYRGLLVDPDTPCPWTDFMGFWAPSPPPGDDYMHDELWWIERDGNTVVRISQQFIP